MAVNPLQGPGVLVVIEPDEPVRTALVTLLQVSGSEVLAVATAGRLPDMLGASTVTAVIAESSLPDMSPFALLAMCSKYGVPVIFTGRGQAVQEAVDLMRAGALDYLQKPFSQERLLRLLPVMAERHNNLATRQVTDT